MRNLSFLSILSFLFILSGSPLHADYFQNHNLRHAARQGDLVAAKAAIAAGANVNAADHLHAETPLARAATEGHLEIVKLLLRSGAEVDLNDGYGLPLLWAARRGHEEILKTLLAAGAKPNARDEHGCTALMWAARIGRTDEVRTLIKAGADVNALCAGGQTALFWAKRYGHGVIADDLLRAGASLHPGPRGIGAWILGLIALVAAAVFLFVVEPRTKLRNARFLSACKSGNLEVLRTLLASGFDVRDEDVADGLRFAVENGHEEAVAALLKAGMHPDSGWFLTTWPDPDEIKGPRDEDVVMWRPLVVAAKNGDERIVELLIKAGASPKIQEEEGDNLALRFAIEAGHADVLRALLKAGADVNAPSRQNGSTPLMRAARKGRAQMVSLLLRSGADPALKNEEGRTALDMASDSDCIAFLKKALAK